MNIMTLIGIAGAGGNAAGSGIVGDSCAFCLFLAGAISLAIAGYLLYKAPKHQALRLSRRRDALR